MLVRLICWKPDLAQEHAGVLEKAGLQVDASPPHVSGLVGHLKDIAPDVIVIDLDRVPSHGDAYASVVRRSKSVSRIPLVFAGGAEEKLAAIRSHYPDAVFSSWDKAAAAVKKAASRAPFDPVRPAPYIQRFAGSPLLKKLDIKANSAVALVAPPEGFEDLLGELPEGTVFQPRMGKDTALAIWFIRSRRELDVTADYLGTRLAKGVSAWVVYPKQAGQHRVDFNLNDVRATMLEAGLVDFKICSVDAYWTGMKFTRKKS